MNIILIITDDTDDAAALRRALGSACDGPYAVVWVRRLSEALERLRADDIDAVLVDLLLPDSRGMATFDRLFLAAPGVPILTLSALDDEVLAIGAVERGARGYLTKGYFSSYLVPQSLRNIIQRKGIEQKLHVESERAAITLNSIADAVIGSDKYGKIDYLNLAGEYLTGWSLEEARGRSITEVMSLLNSITRESIANPLQLALEHGNIVNLELDAIILQRGGKEFFIEDSASPIRDARGKITGAVMVFRDTTAVKKISMEIAHLVQHDVLTHLPNRLLLNDRIVQAIKHAKCHHAAVSIFYLGLDKFKKVNDILGHAIGDRLLQSVAERLRDCIRSADTVSRLGGDEFVVLISEAYHAEDVASTADKITIALAAPHVIDGHEISITSSIGISLFSNDGDTPEILIKNADTAMCEAKKQGRNNYQFFTNAMNLQVLERQLTESSLRDALRRDELVLHYQPKINLKTGAIIGSEALLRWKHPQWGMVYPARFIHVAEDCGLIVPIGTWVLREACRQTMRWKANGLRPGTIAVNVSSLELRQENFVDNVRGILLETELLPRDLQLEITESVLMHDAASSVDVLMQLKAMGVELAVDDFGTGYSSLSYLVQFPIDVLKIDQSFLRDVNTTEKNGIVVGAIIGMGNSLKQRVIAEGIESKSQLDFLREHRCQEGQGYLFSRPVDAVQFAQLLLDGIESSSPGTAS